MIKSTHLVSNMGPLAQSVEQQTFNLWVVGSIPTGPTLVTQPKSTVQPGFWTPPPNVGKIANSDI